MTGRHIYGYCPDCGGRSINRERRPNGDDRCENGHVFPSRTTLEVKPVSPMTPKQFQKFVEVGNFTTNKRDSEFLAAMGLAGEAGEVCDLLKKHLLHGTELNRDELNKELGDVMWYLFHAFNVFGFTFDEVAKQNVEKLCDRYPRGYGFPEDWIQPEKQT